MRTYFIAACLAFIIGIMSASMKTTFAYSNGPPDGRTGSPVDGKTCNDDCHTSYPLNSGTAAFSISAPTSYTAGETINITVSFNNSNTTKHGFELSALDENNNDVGTFNNPDSNTQSTYGNYIKHTFNGTSNISWNIQWTAPTSGVFGPVTFYAAGNEANGDNTNHNDYIYATTLQMINASATPQPTITPTGSGIIYGFVYDEDEMPLKNVTLYLKFQGEDYASTNTDEDGYYIFETVTAGEYDLYATKTGYQTAFASVSVIDETSVEINYMLEDAPTGGSVYGFVKDIYGYPVENVRLKIKGLKNYHTAKTASDKDGFFEFMGLGEDTYVIKTKKKRYKPAKKTVKLKADEIKEIEIEMRRTFKIFSKRH